jgi:hypothetical protein
MTRAAVNIKEDLLSKKILEQAFDYDKVRTNLLNYYLPYKRYGIYPIHGINLIHGIHPIHSYIPYKRFIPYTWYIPYK